MHAKNNLDKQKYLKKSGLMFFITIMNVFIPLSTDLYLPALPTMSTVLGVSAALTNLTPVSFFFFFAVGTLLWGPISDKYGRKPVLLAGTGLYTISSLFCALAGNVYVLIVARIVEGFGAGAIIAVSMALIKDCFSGKQRESMLAIVQSVGGLAPMIAPVLGGILLQFTSWRGSFWVLTGAGALCFVLSALYQETLIDEERYEGTIAGSLGRLLIVSKNMGFSLPCLIFSLYNFAFMAYIAMSSYIYVDKFGLSEQVYSYFFAANAALSIVGPMLYVKFFTKANKRKFAYACFISYVVFGAFLLFLGNLSPFLFWLGFAPFSLMGTISRPFSTGLLLDQQKGDTGSASSLINGIATIFGSCGMVMASMWGDIIFGLGFMILATGVLSILGWAALMRSKVPCVGVKK